MGPARINDDEHEDAAAAAPGSRPALTRADVARLAGVSSAVVSYVVNDGPRAVAPATAARVRDAIERLGYRPNLTARALRRGATDMIGLVLPSGSNPFFAEFAVEIEREAALRGVAVMMASSGGDPARERRLLDSLAGRQVDGILLAPAVMDPALSTTDRAETRTVVFNRVGPLPGFRTLGPDFAGGAASVVDHLIDVHGASSVVLGSGLVRNSAPNSREQGWRNALARHGRPAGAVIDAEFSRAGGYRMGLTLLDGGLPDAVFTSSDLQAVGLLRALHEAGVRVPGDLAVVCFDGTSESEYAWPALTVARQPIAAMAHAAVDAVLDSVALPAGHQSFATELVIRRSCGCGA